MWAFLSSIECFFSEGYSESDQMAIIKGICVFVCKRECVLALYKHAEVNQYQTGQVCKASYLHTQANAGGAGARDQYIVPMCCNIRGMSYVSLRMLHFVRLS